MAARRILTLITSSTIVVSGAVAPAHASPRSDPTTGRAVFTGAASASPTSVTLNPAAIGLDTSATKIYLAVVSTLEQLTIDRKSLDLGTGTLSDGPSVHDAALGPGGDVAFLWHPNDRLALGVAAHLPPPELLPADRSPLRYHTLGVGQRAYSATVGVSLRVTGAIFFGASVGHENTFLHLRYARDTALEAGHGAGGVDSDCGGAPCGVENPAATEIYDVNVRTPLLSASNLRVNVGTVVRVAPDVWIGLAYHTPPGFDIQTTLAGDMYITRAPRDGGVKLGGDANVYVSYPASADLEVRARLPQELDLHVGARWEDLSRMQAYDVRGFGSTFRANGIPEQMLRARGLHDAFAVWAGVEQVDLDTRKPFRFGARVGYETSSVSNARLSPTTVAPAALTLDLGAQARVRAWVIQLSYGIAISPSTSVDRSAFDPRYRLDCIDSDYDYSTRACQATRNGYALPTAAGDYQRIDHALRLGFRYELP